MSKPTANPCENEGIPAGNRGVQGVMAIFIALSRRLAKDQRRHSMVFMSAIARLRGIRGLLLV
ncbi:hypothetical protein D0O09_00710 [Pseudomonas putida]|nr:hypothetical protein D0O09_00710 [Pseudomonas putida]